MHHPRWHCFIKFGVWAHHLNAVGDNTLLNAVRVRAIYVSHDLQFVAAIFNHVDSTD